MFIQQTLTHWGSASRIPVSMSRVVLGKVQGSAMGSSISSIMTNFCMEGFKGKALTSSPNPQTKEKVCGWYLCDQEDRTQKPVLGAH